MTAKPAVWRLYLLYSVSKGYCEGFGTSGVIDERWGELVSIEEGSFKGAASQCLRKALGEARFQSSCSSEAEERLLFPKAVLLSQFH